jgi:hypothetical protein
MFAGVSAELDVSAVLGSSEEELLFEFDISNKNHEYDEQ